MDRPQDISERDIALVMEQTGMERLQALRHLQQRAWLADRANQTRRAAIAKLLERQ